MRFKLNLLDYGVGNIYSLAKALERSGAEVNVVEDPNQAVSAQALALPGVGAFSTVSARLKPVRDSLREKMNEGFPVLAICIGMQILFESSEEGPGDGIGLLPGRVCRLRHQRLPHIGWNRTELSKDPIFLGQPREVDVYYVHSFAPSACGEFVTARANYGGPFAAAIRKENVWGVQFHPEKSSAAGLAMLRAWCEQVSMLVG